MMSDIERNFMDILRQYFVFFLVLIEHNFGFSKGQGMISSREVNNRNDITLLRARHNKVFFSPSVIFLRLAV